MYYIYFLINVIHFIRLLSIIMDYLFFSKVSLKNLTQGSVFKN